MVEGEPLPDGAVVTILGRDGDETFELSGPAEAELLTSLAEADRGETVAADEVLRSLRIQVVALWHASRDKGPEL